MLSHEMDGLNDFRVLCVRWALLLGLLALVGCGSDWKIDDGADCSSKSVLGRWSGKGLSLRFDDYCVVNLNDDGETIEGTTDWGFYRQLDGEVRIDFMSSPNAWAAVSEGGRNLELSLGEETLNLSRD